ncbi:hypothetical protein [Mycolicibacterium hodleri]|uniref:Uncharacterized protein n=1 Tax=Mycolicibacterium hodleri TaxID=49897 RepID=A0A502E755_9MYCO|nr:hypothetical protein [Mycolicibacterium hodleri]TPG33555.1 hypothetical protein EAH80_14825 [Mycolicibacterium hodleri]
MKRWIAAGSITTALMLGLVAVAPARADVPTSCGYPATGYYVRADVAIVIGVLFACDFPREINGAHLHQEALTLDAAFNTGANFTNDGGSNNVGGGLTFGGGAWSSSWRCPDQRYLAEQPNPVGAWNKPMVAGRCNPIGVAPSAPSDTPWPAGDTMQEFVWPPPLVPNSPGPVVSPPVGNDVQRGDTDEQPNRLGIPDGNPPATRVG